MSVGLNEHNVCVQTQSPIFRLGRKCEQETNDKIVFDNHGGLRFARFAGVFIVFQIQQRPEDSIENAIDSMYVLG